MNEFIFSIVRTLYPQLLGLILKDIHENSSLILLLIFDTKLSDSYRNIKYFWRAIFFRFSLHCWKRSFF